MVILIKSLLSWWFLCTCDLVIENLIPNFVYRKGCMNIFFSKNQTAGIVQIFIFYYCNACKIIGILIIVFTCDRTQSMNRDSPSGVVANILDCDITVNEFELQSCYCIHFWTNTYGKYMNPFSLHLLVK